MRVEKIPAGLTPNVRLASGATARAGITAGALAILLLLPSFGDGVAHAVPANRSGPGHGAVAASKLGVPPPATMRGRLSTQRSVRRAIRPASKGGKARVQTASLRSSNASAPAAPSLAGRGITWLASSGCLNSALRNVINGVASVFGAVTVNSTCRGKSHNAAIGGAGHSYHLTGDAADFRIHGNWRAAIPALRSAAGGFKHYGGGLFHIDNGPRRSW